MTGKPVALTERDKTLIREVTRFGVMTRPQLMHLGLFASKTRANERLRRLTDAGYLAARRQPLQLGGPRNVYMPGPNAAVAPLLPRRLKHTSDFHLSHQLGLVDIRLAFERHVHDLRWLTDRELAGAAAGLVPDAYVEYSHAGLMYAAFIELDRGTETHARIERKARTYADLAFTGRFERMFGRQFFRCLVVAESERRLKTLKQTIHRVTNRLFRLTTLDAIRTHGPIGSIWQRPDSDVLESLTVAN